MGLSLELKRQLLRSIAEVDPSYILQLHDEQMSWEDIRDLTDLTVSKMDVPRLR